MIDELTAQDAIGAAALSASFGWPHRPEDWALFLRVGRGFAWREPDGLAGTAMWFPFGGEHASVGLVQVAPRLQGSGIGKRLMRAVMDAAPRNLMLHATVEGAGLYSALGFAPGGKVQQWQGDCTIAGRPDLRVVEIGDVVARDGAATGLPRGDMLRVLLEEATLIADGEGGYAARRRFGRGNLIGPVVATDIVKAARLIGQLCEPGFLRIDVPAECEDVVEGLGLARIDEGQVMTIGAWPDVRNPRLYALAAQALG